MNVPLPFVTITKRYPWINVGLRVLLAVFGAYGLAVLASLVFAVALPLPRIDAVMASIMLSFIVQLLAVVWVFASSTLVRACTGLLLPAIILGLWMSILSRGGTA